MKRAQNGIVICTASHRQQSSARINDSRMLTNHTLQCLHSTLQFTKLFLSHYLISADLTPIWEQTLSLNLLRTKRSTLSIFWLGLWVSDSGRILWYKTYAFMQMAMPICNANLSRENWVPYASCEPRQATNVPRVFFFKAKCPAWQNCFKCSVFRHVDLKKVVVERGKESFLYHWPLKATACPLVKQSQWLVFCQWLEFCEFRVSSQT